MASDFPTPSDKTLVEAVISIIRRHEGYSRFPRPDRGDTVQIGYGTNLTRRGITTGEATVLALADIHHGLDYWSMQRWWSALSTVQRVALLDLDYCLGTAGLLRFHDLMWALDCHHYSVAADAILQSHFAVEDPARAREDARMIAGDGVLP